LPPHLIVNNLNDIKKIDGHANIETFQWANINRIIRKRKIEIASPDQVKLLYKVVNNYK